MPSSWMKPGDYVVEYRHLARGRGQGRVAVVHLTHDAGPEELFTSSAARSGERAESLATLWALEDGTSAWRERFYYPREHRSGAEAKEHAVKMAAQVIAWSGTKGVTGTLGHDAAEAILVGLFGVIEAGWLLEPPRFKR